MSIKLTVDDHLLREKTKRLLKKTGKTEQEFVKEQAALLAQMLAKITPPYAAGQLSYTKGSKYGSAKDKKQGESAIIQDMNRAFRVRDPGFLKFLIKRAGRSTDLDLTLRKKSGESYQIRAHAIELTNESAALKHLRRHRNNRGRIPQSYQSPRWTNPQTMWIPPALFKKVLAAAKNNVGIAKAAHAKAADKLGAKVKPPKWISRHHGKVNTRITTTEAKGYRVSVHASAAGLQHTIPKIIRATQLRAQLALKTLERQHRYDIKKSGFKSK